MTTIYTDAQFEALSWHDCSLHGLELRTGDAAEGDWAHDLALDIDFIVACPSCGVDGPALFRVAPATLVFHEVTDLRIDIDWATPNRALPLHPASIDRIDRDPARRADGVRDTRPYHAWTMSLNWPQGGMIRFGAAGFEQRLRAEPVEIRSDHLSTRQRRPGSPVP